MGEKKLSLRLLGVTIILFGPTHCLPDPKQCGDFYCAISEFCSPISDQCENCSVYCSDEKNAKLCQQYCPGFCEHERYSKIIARLDELYRTVNKQHIAIISMIVIIVLLVLGIVIYFIRRNVTKDLIQKINCFKKFTKNSQKQSETIAVPEITQQIPNTQRQISSGTSVFTISTTTNTRHPSEDASSLDYSYDNAALSVSK